MGFFVALQFLTSLPSPLRREFDAEELGRAQAYFPLVGAFLGLVLIALDSFLRTLFPAQVVAGLLLLALALLTGGLHWDGLIDSCDGLFVRRLPEERLAIMRDSRVGSFGVVGAVFAVLLQYAVLVALSGPQRLPALMLMPAFARWGMVLAVTVFPYGRESGKGSVFRGHGKGPFLFATLTSVVFALALWPDRGLPVLAAVAAWTWLAGRLISARIGGLTGDSYGAIGQVAEVLVLLGALATWRGFS